MTEKAFETIDVKVSKGSFRCGYRSKKDALGFPKCIRKAKSA